MDANSYVEQVLENFDQSNAKPVTSPLANRFILYIKYSLQRLYDGENINNSTIESLIYAKWK